MYKVVLSRLIPKFISHQLKSIKKIISTYRKFVKSEKLLEPSKPYTMDDDEYFTFVPEFEETYSEEETEEALNFIKNNELPMSDIFYALKYIRISHRAVELDDEFQGIQHRLKKLREEDIPVVTPPPMNWYAKNK